MGAAPSIPLISLKQPTAMNQARIIMLGLNGAGKTTVLYRLKLNETIATLPTAGFSVEKIDHKGTSYILWEIPGQANFSISSDYLGNKDGVIVVVDSTDESQFATTKENMDRYLANEDLKGCPLLVLANKQDLPNAADVHIITSKLDLMSRRNNECFVSPCSAVTGDGLFEGLEWMGNTLQRLGRLKTIASDEE
ncbi:hypothetical protein FRC19_009549 [Serendipita sp. 401]|nr:hypothetical protein FRC19_009549 [Serendipita sp. 401]KAG9056990.1 hypothetical protein FS842_009016 [Serendipita sp. 407]